jgi:hypothetical protein
MKFETLKTNIDISKVNPASKVEINDLLTLNVDGTFNSIGLTNRLNERIWFNEFDRNGIKNVIRFQLKKGLGAIFVFGNCFDFLPTISESQKLKNHKTSKSTTVHLFDWSDSIEVKWNLIFKKQLKISVINKKQLAKDLEIFAKNGIEEIKNWFDKNKSIESCIDTCLNQISKGNEYSLHSPNQVYILSFLYAKIGDNEKAEFYFDKYVKDRYEKLNPEIENQIKIKLNTLANNVYKK